MTTAKPYLTLRLAARTLIEWKTPTTSPEYQYVLAELLKVHPNAVSSGFTADKEFFKLDDRGVVLWYLSETMDGKRTELAANQPEQYYDFLKQEFANGLINYGISGESNSKIWTDGPTKSQVADTILKAIDINDKSVKSKGFASLLTILIPLSSELQSEIIKDLMHIHIAHGVLQKLSKKIRNLSEITSYSLLFITFFNTINIIINFLLKSNHNSGIKNQYIFIFSTVLILLLLFSMWILWKQKEVKEFTKDIVMFTSGKNILTSIKYQAIDSAIEFFQMIGDICGNHSKIFVSILKTNCQTPWKEIALTSTKNATSDVIREVLYLLRHPDIDYSLREQIFQWLCRVNLI